MVFHENRFLCLEKVQYLFGRQCRSVDTGGVCRFKCLHERNFFFYTLFADVAVLFRVESPFIIKQGDVGFTDDTFWVLFVPSLCSIEQEVKIKSVQFFSISEVRFEFLNKVVPEQKSVPVKKPGEAHMREGA